MPDRRLLSRRVTVIWNSFLLLYLIDTRKKTSDITLRERYTALNKALPLSFSNVKEANTRKIRKSLNVHLTFWKLQRLEIASSFGEPCLNLQAMETLKMHQRQQHLKICFSFTFLNRTFSFIKLQTSADYVFTPWNRSYINCEWSVAL